MRRPASSFERLVTSGGLEIVLAAAMASLSLLGGWWIGEPLGVVVDVAMYVVAVATIRYPRTAGSALLVLLAVYFFAPNSWLELGQYAPLLASVGLGLRGRVRLRTGLGVGFLAVYVGLQVQAYGATRPTLFGSIVWATLLALSWLLGSALHHYDQLQRDLRQAALNEQRLRLARGLHDTVARTLAQVALQARQASADRDVDALDDVADGVSRAAAELRWLLNVLREPNPEAQLAAASGSVAEAVQRAAERLRADGLQFSATLEGDPTRVSEPVGSVVVLAIGEAVANIERHGAPDAPSGLILSVGDDAVDLVAMNRVADTGTDATNGFGLVGLRERLSAVGGELDVRREGSQWLMRAHAPLTASG